MSLAFDIAYGGTPSWETGRPQGVVRRLIERGALAGAVLDAGCGTGTHAVLLATLGHRVTGIDVAARAIELAAERAGTAGVGVELVVGDVLDASTMAALPGAPFDSVLDVGLFHVLQPHDRRRYATLLAGTVRPGGVASIACWSDRNPFGYGPERVTRRALRSSFRRAEGWRVESIEPERLETLLEPGAVHAWLATVRRLAR